MPNTPGFSNPPSPKLSDASPLASGAAAPGTSLDVSRADHVHPAGSTGPALSNAVPLVAGTGAAGTALDCSRSDHIHPAQAFSLPVTPSTPTRVLGATFQPSATKAVLCSYSVNTQATNPLLAGASSATVTLLSDASNPPTTERCRAAASSSVGLAVAVAITTSNTTPLIYIAPPGHYVRLVSSVTGTAATTIVSQTEEVLG